MLSKNSTEPQASPRGGAEAGAARDSTPLLDPQSVIDVASGGGGTINDPAGNDTKPPGIGDLELLV